MPLPDVDHIHIHTNGIRLHAVTAGPADGPVVLMLHGFPEFWYSWRHQIGPLADAGFRVVALDQRGHNTSDKPRGVRAYGMEQLMADVVGVIDHLGVEQVDIVCHDWGGAVGWTTTRHHPERIRRLAALNIPHPAVMRDELRSSFSQLRRSWYMAAFQLPFLPEAYLGRNRAQALVDALVRSSVPGAFTAEDLERYRTAYTQPHAIPSMLNWYRAALRYPGKWFGKRQITVPTLLIWGRDDHALGEEMAQPSIDLCDDGRLVKIDGAGHFVMCDAPDRVTAELLSFLEP